MLTTRFIFGLTAEEATAIFTGFLVIVGTVTALIMIVQSYLLRGSVDLARKEFIAAHRPRLRASNVVIRNPIHSKTRWFWSGELVSGQLYVTNVGSSIARIVHSHCEVFWRKGTLPMNRPYEGKTPNEFLQFPKLVPGAPATGVFQSESPMGADFDDLSLGSFNWRLWVMGYIEYADANDFVRRTDFCRVWTMPDERFFPVDDKDYESEE